MLAGWSPEWVAHTFWQAKRWGCSRSWTRAGQNVYMDTDTINIHLKGMKLTKTICLAGWKSETAALSLKSWMIASFGINLCGFSSVTSSSPLQPNISWVLLVKKSGMMSDGISSSPSSSPAIEASASSFLSSGISTINFCKTYLFQATFTHSLLLIAAILNWNFPDPF